MNYMNKRQLVVVYVAGILIAMGLSGCTTVRYRSLTNLTYPPKLKNEEIFITTRDIDIPYEELGIFLAYNYRGIRTEPLMRFITKKARKIGASAVIKFQCGKSMATSQTFVPLYGFGATEYIIANYKYTTCQGVVIKCIESKKIEIEKK